MKRVEREAEKSLRSVKEELDAVKAKTRSESKSAFEKMVRI